jgi:transposase
MKPTKEADMELYVGIDLHGNNSVVTVLDEQDRTIYAKRLANDLN